VKLFNDWFSAYSKTSREYSDRDLTRDAFLAGMLAAADIADKYPLYHAEEAAEDIRNAANQKRYEMIDAEMQS